MTARRYGLWTVRFGGQKGKDECGFLGMDVLSTETEIEDPVLFVVVQSGILGVWYSWFFFNSSGVEIFAP